MSNLLSLNIPSKIKRITNELINFALKAQRVHGWERFNSSYQGRSFESMQFSFHYSYSCLDVVITERPERFKSDVQVYPLDYRLLGQGKAELYSDDDILNLGYLTAEAIHFVLPDIRQNNAISVCEWPLHKGYRGWDVCDMKLGKMICEECQSHFSDFQNSIVNAPILPSSVMSRKDKIKQERAKATVKVRFEVLERDSFTCKSCGRNPRDHDVVLHVDHIHPVSKGGKTKLDNLQTLCQDCNLGKSDKVVSQMGLW